MLLLHVILFDTNLGDMILDGDTAFLCSNSSASYDLSRLLADPLMAHDVREILARVLDVEGGGTSPRWPNVRREPVPRCSRGCSV